MALRLTLVDVNSDGGGGAGALVFLLAILGKVADLGGDVGRSETPQRGLDSSSLWRDRPVRRILTKLAIQLDWISASCRQWCSSVAHLGGFFFLPAPSFQYCHSTLSEPNWIKFWVRLCVRSSVPVDKRRKKRLLPPRLPHEKREKAGHPSFSFQLNWMTNNQLFHTCTERRYATICVTRPPIE